MSINSLTNAALARRSDFEPANAVPASLSEIADAAASTPKAVGATASAPGDGTNTTLQTLTTYIPTEILTLYVAAVAALGPSPIPLKIDDHVVDVGRWLPFWCFLAATPLLVWVAFATKIKVAGKPIPVSPFKWPWWEITAATLAYVAWTFAMPNTPFAQYRSWYSPALASFLVLVISAGLGALAPLMQRPLPS